MDRADIFEANRRAYDAMAARQEALCRPAKDGELADPLGTVDAAGWLGPSISGWRVLCLAAGGGRQSALYAAAGAEVTVVDLSGAMLELDRRVAAERGFSVRLLNTPMDELSMLAEGEFDLVVHPVSTCYVPDVRPVFREVARVTRPGGLYVSQHKSPVSLQAGIEPTAAGRYTIEHTYYRTEPVPPPEKRRPAAARLRESGAIEFLHRWEQLVGGICRAGFVVEDLVEPVHARDDAQPGSFAGRARYVAPYLRIKARRIGGGEGNERRRLWTPD